MAAVLEGERKLTRQQIELLELFYRFRILSAFFVAESLDLGSTRVAHNRLQRLVERGYIGKRYERTYRLLGKPAYYFLLSKSIRALSKIKGPKHDSAVLRAMYKDRRASERFYEHSLHSLALFCQLNKKHPGLIFYSKSQLYASSFLRESRPDAAFRIKGGRYRFVQIIDPATPSFAIRRLVEEFGEFIDSGEWEEATQRALPELILLCESKDKQRIHRTIDSLEDELSEQTRIGLHTLKDI